MTENQRKLIAEARIVFRDTTLLRILDIIEDAEPEPAPPPASCRVEFRRMVCEKSFLKFDTHNEGIAHLQAMTTSQDDPRLEWEPVSATMEIVEVKKENP